MAQGLAHVQQGCTTASSFDTLNQSPDNKLPCLQEMAASCQPPLVDEDRLRSVNAVYDDQCHVLQKCVCPGLPGKASFKAFLFL